MIEYPTFCGKVSLGSPWDKRCAVTIYRFTGRTKAVARGYFQDGAPWETNVVVTDEAAVHNNKSTTAYCKYLLLLSLNEFAARKPKYALSTRDKPSAGTGVIPNIIGSLRMDHSVDPPSYEFTPCTGAKKGDLLYLNDGPARPIAQELLASSKAPQGELVEPTEPADDSPAWFALGVLIMAYVLLVGSVFAWLAIMLAAPRIQ